MPDRATPPPSDAAAAKRMTTQRRRDTGPEMEIRRRLHRRGYRYRVDERLPGTRRRADLLFPRRRLAVFVDGCFWHRCPEHGSLPKANRSWWEEKLNRNVARDRDTDSQLAALGWSVVRIWAHEDPDVGAERVADALEERPVPPPRCQGRE